MCTTSQSPYHEKDKYMCSVCYRHFPVEGGEREKETERESGQESETQREGEVVERREREVENQQL